MLASRVILYYNLNLLLPLSKVDENMRRAHARDALATQKFHFRSSLRPASEEEDGAAAAVEMTASEVLMGNGKAYKGLVPMIMAYLDRIGADGDTTRAVSSYMEFIALRASGELLTPAAWMRAFVRKHPDYQQDSVVPPRAAADLLKAAHRIGLGLERCPEMHGDFPMPPIATTDAYAVPLRRGEPQAQRRRPRRPGRLVRSAHRAARAPPEVGGGGTRPKELAAMQCELQAIDTAIAGRRLAARVAPTATRPAPPSQRRRREAQRRAEPAVARRRRVAAQVSARRMTSAVLVHSAPHSCASGFARQLMLRYETTRSAPVRLPLAAVNLGGRVDVGVHSEVLGLGVTGAGVNEVSAPNHDLSTPIGSRKASSASQSSPTATPPRRTPSGRPKAVPGITPSIADNGMSAS